MHCETLILLFMQSLLFTINDLLVDQKSINYHSHLTLCFRTWRDWKAATKLPSMNLLICSLRSRKQPIFIRRKQNGVMSNLSSSYTKALGWSLAMRRKFEQWFKIWLLILVCLSSKPNLADWLSLCTSEIHLQGFNHCKLHHVWRTRGASGPVTDCGGNRRHRYWLWNSAG